MNKKKEKRKHAMVQRTMGILLAAVMVFNTLPISGFAVFASEKQETGFGYELQADPDTANASVPVDGEVAAAYQEASWDGSAVIYANKNAENCTPVTESTEAVTWDAGWYVVNNTVTVEKPITVNGDVNLILADGCTLNAAQGIVVTENNSLTIYAQAGGTGTLNATGVAEGDNVSAGIGGSSTSPDSGTITIHGGVISATGGSAGAYYTGGAGIGGGTSSSENGGSNGVIIIYNGTITAASGQGGSTGAGIGGGSAGTGSQGIGGAGSDITIYGGSVTATSNGMRDTGGAGIGGGGGIGNGGEGSNITICGGTVTATGGNRGAGIGGGGSVGTSGAGSNITISGGEVTAIGGRYAAGIGGGGGYIFIGSHSTTNITGGTGTGIRITGGIVEAQGGAENSSDNYTGDPIGNGGNSGVETVDSKIENAIVFEDGEGKVHGTVILDGDYTLPADYSLTIPAGASLSGSGKLSGGGTFQTENVTADMISGTEGLVYNGTDHTDQIELEENVTICGAVFSADITGWTMRIDPAEVKNAGNYTVTLEKEGSTPITTTFTVAECPHTGLVYAPLADGRHGGTCTSCGTEVSEEHTWEDGVCAVCNSKAVVKVESGGETVYYADFGAAWDTVNVHDKDFTVTLLSDVEVAALLKVEASNVHITFVGGEHTLKLDEFYIDAGKLTVTSGTIIGSTYGVWINGGILEVTGGKIEAEYYGIYVNRGTARLSGGAIQGDIYPIIYQGSVKVGQALLNNGDANAETHYAFYKGDTPVELPDESFLRSGTYTVAECKHDASVCAYQTLDGGTSHKKTCLACGMTWDAESHTLGADNKCEGCKTPLVASVEIGNDATYYGTIESAWTAAQGKTATLTLLNHVTTNIYLEVDNGSSDITFIGGNYTLTSNYDYAALGVRMGTLTIESGTIDSLVAGVKVNGGTFKFTGGKVKANSFGIEAVEGTVRISGGEIIGSDCVRFDNSNADVKISGGTLTGNSTTIRILNGKASDVLLNYGTATEPHYAFYQDTQPVKLPDGDTLSSGTYTVQVCMHGYTYTHTNGTTKHTQSCQYCGDTKEDIDCSFTWNGAAGECACGAALNVAVSDTDKLTYDGTAKEPGVAVTLDGTALDTSTYTVAYDSNVNAGNNTASVTVSGMNWSFTKKFTIEKALLTVTAIDQEITYGQSIMTGRKSIAWSELCDGDRLDTSGFTLTASTEDVPGGTITPSDVVIKKTSSGEDVTGNYEIIYVNGKLTIRRAEGTLTISETSINKKFGEDEFALNCSTNGDGKISYASSNENVASVSADGNVLIKGAGETIITVCLGEGTNHTGGAEAMVTVTVAKADAPAAISTTRKYTYANGSKGDVTINVAGKLPKDRGQTEYTVDITADEKGILSDVSVDKNGNLSYTVPGNKSEGDTASITVTAKMANYENAAYTVNIELVEKKVVEPQAGSSVSVKGSNILTYGQMLSVLTLDSVIFVEKETDTEVKGTLAWKDPSDVPVVATGMAKWVFTPEDSNEYLELTGMAAITVVKATPEAEAPTADAVAYNPSGTLSGVDLNHGSATWTVGGSMVTVGGTWGWKDASAVPAVGNRGYTAVFTPEDTANYNTVECIVAVPVEKAEPYIADPPTAAQITYGDALGASVLTGGTVQYSGSDNTAVAGSFAWKNGAIKPAVSDSGSTEYTVVFTPADSTDYSSVETKITLIIEKAENAPNMPSAAMHVARKCEKVSDVELPAGWQWDEADRDAALESGVQVTAAAVYAGADKDNYKNVTVAVTITRSNCDHENKEFRNVVIATCQEKGYSGDTYCKDCGELLEKGTETDLAAHSYLSEVTQEPTVSAEGVMTYTCTRCGDSYAKPIDRLPDTPSEPGSRPESGKPFIKDEPGKDGWKIIKEETDKAEDGNTVTVDMNGSTVVPGDVLENIRSRDITVVFDMGNGITWSVNGKTVEERAIGNIDFSVETGTEMIPVDIINNLTGERDSIQISLAYEGEFGFTAVLSINLGKENAGFTASLYYYNEISGELELVSTAAITEDGIAGLTFTHASDYVIAIDGNGTAVPESPQTGQEMKNVLWPIVACLIALAGIAFAAVPAWKKKEEND